LIQAAATIDAMWFWFAWLHAAVMQRGRAALGRLIVCCCHANREGGFGLAHDLLCAAAMQMGKAALG